MCEQIHPGQPPQTEDLLLSIDIIYTDCYCVQGKALECILRELRDVLPEETIVSEGHIKEPLEYSERVRAAITDLSKRHEDFVVKAEVVIGGRKCLEFYHRGETQRCHLVLRYEECGFFED